MHPVQPEEELSPKPNVFNKKTGKEEWYLFTGRDTTQEVLLSFIV